MPKRSYENRTIEVILLQDHQHLGEKFETVRVKPIFAKNVLLPQEIAVLATPKAQNDYAQKIIAAQAERKKKVKGLEDFFEKIIQSGGITITRKMNEKQSLYDKIDATDLISTIDTEFGIKLNPKSLMMKKKITTTGEYTIPFLYQSLKKEIPVIVKGELDKKEKAEKKVESTDVAESTKEETTETKE